MGFLSKNYGKVMCGRLGTERTTKIYSKVWPKFVSVPSIWRKRRYQKPILLHFRNIPCPVFNFSCFIYCSLWFFSAKILSSPRKKLKKISRQRFLLQLLFFQIHRQIWLLFDKFNIPSLPCLLLFNPSLHLPISHMDVFDLLLHQKKDLYYYY